MSGPVPIRQLDLGLPLATILKFAATSVQLVTAVGTTRRAGFTRKVQAQNSLGFYNNSILVFN